jgi:uncharacterized coiled-coil protein SlyX
MSFKDPEKRRAYNRSYKARQREVARQAKQEAPAKQEFKSTELETEVMEAIERYFREGLAIIEAIKAAKQEHDELEEANRNLRAENEALGKEREELERLIEEMQKAKGQYLPPNPLTPDAWRKLQSIVYRSEGHRSILTERLASIWGVPPYPTPGIDGRAF